MDWGHRGEVAWGARDAGRSCRGQEEKGTTSTNTCHQDGGNREETTDGRSTAKESPEPRNDRKEATRTEEPPKGGHQGFGDTGEKALWERGMLDGAAEEKHLAKSHQEETIIEEPPKGGDQD